MTQPLRVGIIGASVTGRWASGSHVPAVQKLAGLELAAVATRDQASADAAAKAFGAAKGYGDAKALIADPDIDVVVVGVKVPDHHPLVLAALAAGKHLLCEWPLGRDTAEAEELADAADAAGVHAAVGLQSRADPAARQTRKLLTSGAIGRVLSARLYSETVAFGRAVGAGDLYLEDEANGATLLTIHGGHPLDLAIMLFGGPADLTALSTTQYPEVEVRDAGRKQPRTIPDHLLVLVRLDSGAPLAVEVVGGRPPGKSRFRLEVTGTDGDLALDGGADRGFQSGRLRLSLSGEPQQVDEGETSPMPDMAANVAAVYAALRDDIRWGTRTVTDFRHAVRLTRLIADVTSSARTGTRKSAADWPVQ